MEPERPLPHSQKDRHLSLSWARSIQSMPSNPSYWRSILTFSSLSISGFSKSSVSFRFPCDNPVPLISPIHATCPTHVILLDLITRIISGEEFRSLCFLSCSLLHSPRIPTLSTLSSSTLSLCDTIPKQIYVSLSVCSVIIWDPGMDNEGLSHRNSLCFPAHRLTHK